MFSKQKKKQEAVCRSLGVLVANVKTQELLMIFKAFKVINARVHITKSSI
jgi:hypothetical protein